MREATPGEQRCSERRGMGKQDHLQKKKERVKKNATAKNLSESIFFVFLKVRSLSTSIPEAEASRLQQLLNYFPRVEV